MGKCSICGEPMPPGEEMFKFHGYSGPCPTTPKQSVDLRIEIKRREDEDGTRWLEAFANGEIYDLIGPFYTEADLKRASDDLLEMLKSVRAH